METTPELIGQLVEQIRPDWDPYVVRAIATDLAQRVALADLVCVCVRAASNPDLHNPRSILWRGPHWHGVKDPPPEVAPKERCRTCGKIEPRCVMDRPGPDDHPFDPMPLPDQVAS